VIRAFVIPAFAASGANQMIRDPAGCFVDPDEPDRSGQYLSEAVFDLFEGVVPLQAQSVKQRHWTNRTRLSMPNQGLHHSPSAAGA